MFTTGQWVFALLFTIVFIYVLARAYGKDKKLHRKNYRGVRWVGLVFIAFVIILFVIKYFLKY